MSYILEDYSKEEMEDLRDAYGKEFVAKYLESGKLDDFQDGFEVARLLSQHLQDDEDREYFIEGMREFEDWYGDKAYRRYDDFWNILIKLYDLHPAVNGNKNKE